MKRLLVCSIVFALFGIASLASAQQGDVAFGFGTLLSTSSNSNCVNSSANLICPEKGGLYPKIGADVIFHKRFGIAGDVVWRGGQGNYAGSGLPFRPILVDFNGAYQPRLGKKAGLDLVGGIGWQDTRFYTSNYTCTFVGCTNYTTSKHFLVDAGAGIRYYVWGHVFVRPEFRLYHIVNNTADFTSNNVIHVGASIGYTIGPE